MNTLDQILADLTTIENDILPDLQESLARLTSPDYDPGDNDDHEYWEQDIEYLAAEIAEAKAEIVRLKKRLNQNQEADND